MLRSGVSPFSFDKFALTVLKNFMGNAFNLPEIFGYRNFLCMRTENHVLQSRNFVAQYAKKSWEPLLSFRIFGISETFMRITVFLRFFLSHSTEKLREEPSNVSKSFKWEVSKNLMQKNGISRLSVQNFLSQSAEKFRWGTFRYIRKVRLSKNFMPKKVILLFSVIWIYVPITAYKFGWGTPLWSRIFGTSKNFMLSRGVLRFSVDFFGLTVLKIFVGNAFNLPEIFGYRNFLCMKTENHVPQSKFFVSQYAKISWEPLLSFRIFGISETFMRITVFLRIFCLTVPKNLVRNHLMFQKVSNVRYRKKIEWERNITIFRRKFFGSECRTISLWNTSVYQKSSAIEKFHA